MATGNAGGNQSGGAAGGGGRGPWDGLKSAGKMLLPALKDMVGPMMLLYLGADKLTKSLFGAARNAREMARALQASEVGRRLEIEFTKLMGSAQAATRHVKSLAQAAQALPFSFEAIGQASKNLFVFSNGAMRSAKDLRAVADAAVAAGAPIDAVAAAMGSLKAATNGANWDRWKEGVGSAAGELVNLGVLSQQTAKRMREMQEGGASGGEMWAVAQRDLQRADGAAAKMKGTITGLKQELANLQQENTAQIGRIFEDGEKAAARTSVEVEKLRGKMEAFASSQVAPLLSFWERLKESIVGVVAELAKGAGKISGFVSAAAVGSVLAFHASMLLVIASLVALVSWLVKAAGGWRAAGAAAAASGKSMAVFAGFCHAATVALHGVAIATMLVIAKLEELTNKAESAAAALKDVNSANASAVGGAMDTVNSVRTEEDRTVARKKLSSQIEVSAAAMKEAEERRVKHEQVAKEWEARKKAADQGNESWPRFVMNQAYKKYADLNILSERTQADAAGGEAQSHRNALGTLFGLQEQLNGVPSHTLAADAQTVQTARERADLVKQIRQQGIERSIEATGGFAGSGLARSNLARLEEEGERVEAFNASRAKDDRSVAEQQDALNKGISNERQAQITGALPDEAREQVRDAMQNLTNMAGDENLNEASRITAEIARQQAAKQMMDDDDRAVAEAQLFGTGSEVERKERVMAAQNRQEENREMLAGMGLTEESITPAGIQALEQKRQQLGDSNNGIEVDKQIEMAKRMAEQRDMQEAAQGFETDSDDLSRRTAVGTMQEAAGLGDADGAARRQAEKDELARRQRMEQGALIGTQRADDYEKKAAAAEAAGNKDAADYFRREAIKARESAMSLGGGGRSAEQISSSLRGMTQQQQQLELSGQAVEARNTFARDEETAARQKSMLMAQIDVGDGKYGTQFDAEQDEIKRKLENEERAKAATQEADSYGQQAAALRAEGNTGEADAMQALADAARLTAAKYGASGRSAEEIASAMKDMETQIKTMDLARFTAGRNESESALVGLHEVQARYGRTQEERDAGRKAADDLTESVRTRQLTAGYMETYGVGEDEAGEMASRQAQIERLGNEIEREGGAPPVSDLAAVGGSANWAGVVQNDSDKLDRIRELQAKQVTTMQEMNAKMQAGIELARANIPETDG